MSDRTKTLLRLSTGHFVVVGDMICFGMRLVGILPPAFISNLMGQVQGRWREVANTTIIMREVDEIDVMSDVSDVSACST